MSTYRRLERQNYDRRRSAHRQSDHVTGAGMPDQYGCSSEVALKFLLKIRKYPQGANEDDEAYAARPDGLPDPDVKIYRGIQVANDVRDAGFNSSGLAKTSSRVGRRLLDWNLVCTGG
jgi:hypothetical protein